MPLPRHEGRHELGQNFLTDPATISAFVALVARTEGPVVEIGGGDGALTVPLQRLGRPLTVLEADSRTAARLRRRTAAPTTVLHADFLRWKAPRAPHVLVGNLPFHRTTAMLRRILHASDWTDAVLLVQWEVARRRAGVGGATMMTAQWWPWYDFRLVQRVPAAAFRPRPGVDGGLLTVSRRTEPLLAPHERHRYQDFVHRVFTGSGRGLIEIIPRAARDRGGPRGTGRGAGGGAGRGTAGGAGRDAGGAGREARGGDGRGAALPRGRLLAWLRGHGIRPGALPKSLTAVQWTELYHLADRSTGADAAPAPGTRADTPAHRSRAREGTRARRRKTVSGE
ncbi:23S ribosomal RNA methyltransferase Erm [Streptomyces sp. DW4-2]|uniref:23S ribosomal RNA methyltransferase Erm n=1 Tax=Streptomyces spirodelae TaxID=2812904 RepID=A0ABS3WN65_9ACTN|nr:23S ribosomal RNA methyltransferase Erm [Streptomyces spirodelae]